MSKLVSIIQAADRLERDRSLDEIAETLSLADVLAEAAALETFRHECDNLYERVRACFFLYSIYRYHLPLQPTLPLSGRIPFAAYEHFLHRQFEGSIRLLLAAQAEHGPSDTLSSALAAAYHRLAFQNLADQVRKSVRSVRGNQWMFRVGHPLDQPLRIRPELMAGGDFPVLRELTPVRMDLTHTGWSDIFFLGMDYPEGARVLNISIDLAVLGRDSTPKPPVEAYFRVIDEPVIRLASVDLEASADITDIDEIFDFGRDYLGLLKAALIASGIVAPGLEGSNERLQDLLARVAGPGRGIELVSSVNGIPKGSRLAVSTNLLAALIAACMRATGQTEALEGPLNGEERRLVAARAILGEWLAGSGGGWQDSGGVWPGIKLIEGQRASEGDPEYGISRGRLLPAHRILGEQDASAETRQKLQDSLVLVHGGMAQNVGPILEMVTEKYLLRCQPEWNSRQEAIGILDAILDDLKTGDIAAIGRATTGNFFGPIQTIVPWSSNLYTETLIANVRKEFGDSFWGFWMLGGMSGGGMGFIFEPSRKAEAQRRLQAIMSDARRVLNHSLPFAMEPVVYDFSINENGTCATLLTEENALLPSGYYAMMVPQLVRQDPRNLPQARRVELDRFATACHTRPELSGMVKALFDHLLPRQKSSDEGERDLSAMLAVTGFDPVAHEQVRADLKSGRIGLAQNRLPVSSTIRDVAPGDVVDGIGGITPDHISLGKSALANGELAIVTLAAGAGSRWTQGAGVVKALHPFAKIGGKHRTFIETHLAKSLKAGHLAGASVPHVFTTSYLTHEATRTYLDSVGCYGYEGPLYLSQGQSIGLRMIPMVRDMRFAWEEMPQQVLDAQAQKLRASGRAALIEWAQKTGEGSDYTDNVAQQCLHPVGHWYEVPNMLKNGVLAAMLSDRPQLKYLLVHNIDTLGANADPGLLGSHIERGAALTLEVIPRRLEDRGGGLARVNDRVRLVEGLAMPREEDEFDLTYYNSLTTWVTIDRLLDVFGLTRDCLGDTAKVTAAIRRIAARMPTYVTLKDVKRRWGHGQEDTFPVAQFEKLWGDMTALPEVNSHFIAVPRFRGQQLKEQAQLDGWLRDRSAAYVESLCEWQ